MHTSVFFSFFLKSKFCQMFKYSRSQISMPKNPSETQYLKILTILENDYRLLDKGFKCNKIRLALRKKNMYDFEMKNLCINITKYYILRAFG